MSIQTSEFVEVLKQDLSRCTSRHVHTAIACHMLENAILKKYSPGDITELQSAAALAKFLRANLGCAKGPSWHPLLPKLRSKVWDFLPNNPDFVAEYAAKFEIGPGASVRVPSRDLYAKLFGARLLYSHPLQLRMYRGTTPGTLMPTLDEAEQAWGLPTYAASTLSYVPKNTSTARTICTEPVLAMALQQCIRRVMERCLKQRGIDLSTQQQKNRRFARYGSFNGSFGTIDLESASDTVSLALCQYLLPSSWLSAMMCARSAEVKLPDGSLQRLFMMSSMGNAFTFPLQTVIFAAAVEVCYEELRIARKRGRSLRYCVNGDDIIVAAKAFDMVCELLTACGFTINRLKSFNTGLFRESCGGDFFAGYPVRGVYVKRLDADPYIYSAINRLEIWSRTHGVRLSRTKKYLLGLLSGPLRVCPIGHQETDGLWCTRREARSLCPTVRVSNIAGQTLAYRVWSAVPRSRLHRYPLPGGAVQAAVSGAVPAIPSPRNRAYGSLTQLAKVQELEWRGVVRHTSVWPEWEEWLSSPR